jgi:hypothetical protein
LLGPRLQLGTNEHGPEDKHRDNMAYRPQTRTMLLRKKEEKSGRIIIIKKEK